MERCVELPISKPLFCTYGFQIPSTVIFERNPSLKNWAMNSLIFLRCNPNFLMGLSTSPEVFMSRSGYQDCPYLERNEVSLKFLGAKCHAAIKAMLEDDCYVYYSNIDNSLIYREYPHHKKIFPQSGIICGYDQDAATYSILTCDQNWNTLIVKIPQRWIEYGRKKSLEAGMIGTLCAIKPKTTKVNLNLKEIYQNLKSYTEFDLKTAVPYKETSKVYGAIVHNYIAMYIDYLYKNIIPYKEHDPALFQQVVEFETLMQERLETVEKALKMDRTISNNYKDIVAKSEEIRDLYSEYGKTKNREFLLRIRNRLNDFAKEERLLLSQFVINMEGLIG